MLYIIIREIQCVLSKYKHKNVMTEISKVMYNQNKFYHKVIASVHCANEWYVYCTKMLN